jgi:multiple sugar transport system permease protein
MRAKKVVVDALSYLVLTVAAILTLFPVAWALLTSFKQRTDIFTATPVFFFTPTLRNYIVIFSGEYIWHIRLLNSFIIAGTTTLICVMIGALAAYGFTRYDWRHADSVANWILSIRFLPAVAVAIPWFIIFNYLRLLDTYVAVIITYITFTLPFAVWLLRGFFVAIPRELDEAALTEGYSRLEILLKIIFPLAKPGIIITSIFSMIFAWNEFLFALLLTRANTMTTPVALSTFLQGFLVEWGPLFAATMVTTLPFIIAVIILQKHIVRGLTLGAVSKS